MEVGAHVWLRREDSHWGWVPAIVTNKEPVTARGVELMQLTLNDDPNIEVTMPPPANSKRGRSSFNDHQSFQEVIVVDPEQLKTADHDDIKLRNLPTSYQLSGEDAEAGVIASPSTHSDSSIVGGVDDLIELTHLHEPAILHALRLRYDADIIYTSTGPILIAVNPFKPMPLYSDQMMEQYRMQGELGIVPSSPTTTTSAFVTPFRKRKEAPSVNKRLPPHVYQTADDSYRAMMRGLENKALMNNNRNSVESRMLALKGSNHTNQSILVSGESGAGKTVTTKIVLNYFAMLSKIQSDQLQRSTPRKNGSPSYHQPMYDDVTTEQQVLQSNPILESFGNARTSRNDNSSRFGKYIDISFSRSGKLSGASIETYLLEKVRLIHPSSGERNYHVFYQFLSSATGKERRDFYLGNKRVGDFRLLSSSGTYDRRDGVSDEANHQEMLDAMVTMGFEAATIQSLMRLVVAVLFAGNMTFTPTKDGEACTLDKSDSALACASLLGITYEGLASALTARTILAGEEVVHKTLTFEEATKALEALIKAVYGAAFDYVVENVNESIYDADVAHEAAASIGVLDIFGFESFQTNSFEQLCINYTNEALQQQFNKYVFKLEQQEYEREGIMWKFIAFPDNQDVLDLIDKKHTGILALLDEQCILPRSTDQKFTRYLYARCDKHTRFSASSAQRVDYLFSIEHYAGYVAYTTDSWLEKNKDQLPAASSDLLNSSTFGLIGDIKKFIRSEDRAGRGTVATKSVSSQFSTQLRILRNRIDVTTPHYIRCLKPNDELSPNFFEPKNVVEQLRCGGVLEAVRVSRAGYPTRYPHDIFMARYYILGDKKDITPMSPIFSPTSSNTPKEEDLKRLISKIAFDLWEADHIAMENLIQAEKMASESESPSKKFGKQLFPDNNGNKKINTGPASVNAPPFSLVVESSVMTPEAQRKKKLGQRSKRRESHHVTRPETEADFLKLDFASRCAVAGLQLGRTKVFLRREAFDRIEAMRSDKFCEAARTIQKVVRGKLCKMYYGQMRRAAIKIQSLIRMRLSTFELYERRVIYAAVKIQAAWRSFYARLTYYEIGFARRDAARAIQRAYRSYVVRTREPQFHLSEDDILRAIVAVQAMYRGAAARAYVTEILNSYQEAPTPSPVKSLPAAAPEPSARQIALHESPQKEIVPLAANPAMTTELFREIQMENWAMVESILDKHPELAQLPDLKTGELALHKISRHTSAWTLLIDMALVLYPKALVHRDNMGALPIHHAAAHDNLAALEIIYSAYKEGIKDADNIGRLPIHVAAHYDAIDAIKFLLAKSPEGAYTMVVRPQDNSGGGLPLHVACSNHASVGVITALLAENFASAKRTDENGDLPLHLLLRRGDGVDPVVVKTLLTCFANAVSRTDMHGDLPLAIAIKSRCRSAVINAILMQYPEAAGALNGAGHSALFLAFQHNADDRTIMGLLNHAPELATAVDKKTGMLPIQVATENEHSHFIVHNLLKRDMPIDVKEKVRAQLVPHRYSWNHVVSNTDDLYHQVVTKILQSCTQPQVLALAHVEGPDGTIALAAATPVCKHEMRVMLRLFNTLEVVNQKPAYTNPHSDTQIFYALRYDPPAQKNGTYTVLHDERDQNGDNDYLEDWDDSSQVSAISRNSIRSTLTSRSQQTIEDKLRQIRKEKGQQVIAKLTSRSDVVERELKVRKDYHLSRHYVPAIISVHHTVQHAAYSEAMAEPGYCITMEGADTTAENLMLDMRKNKKRFPTKALKRVGISLMHLHEHGIIHGDFGTHNIGKFGSRWKLLGVGGSVTLGEPTDPTRGFYHPPESIVVENKRGAIGAIGKKNLQATTMSIPADPTYDIWAFGVVVYEAIAGLPLSPYACRGKREMNASEVCKIGLWDENSVRKALKHVQDDDVARDFVKHLLHHDPVKRFNSMRQVLEHPFFLGGKVEGKSSSSADPTSPTTLTTNNSSGANASRPTSNRQTYPGPSNNSKKTSQTRAVDHPAVTKADSAESSIENYRNGVKSSSRRSSGTSSTNRSSPTSSMDSRRSFRGLRKIRMRSGSRQQAS
ncbi:Myosin type-2 heavy chain [Seminavis robusta]|uniref:Myosin type-2 heavy chain n=1 Tax=Seminavis robusta TaxID=568900 RepID=A0A9N8DG58_9STRA|nr:Myosin type-2 heavy chain [Seminavis robusta]|eukprot:Sro125_g060370.1 Myosin type-2 heavy chain (2043) ;mRNA; f:95123-101424